MRRLGLLVLVLLLALPAAAGAAPRGEVVLDEGWEFTADPRGARGWSEVDVPHVMRSEATPRTFAGGVGTYRLRFTAPEGDFALRFEAVRRRARVLLNGIEIGRNDDPYTPFELPARGLRPGAENELVVQVDNRRTPGYREGWWNWGGITREVSLVPQGRVQLRGPGLLSDVRCSGPGACRTAVLVDTWVRNRTAGVVRPLVAVKVGDRQKTVRARAIPPGEEARVRFRLPMPGARLWDPEQPELHDAVLQARLGEEAESTERRRIGLRSVAVRGGRLLINGRRADVRGASIQEDVPGRGPALTDADVERIVADLKALGANVTRAHYLLDERLLTALDEAGILVWSQAPVYHRDRELFTAAGRRRELAVLRRTILAARSHPSVMTHSVANELREDAYATSRAWLATAAAAARDLDPTLPVSVDVLSWPGLPRQAVYDRFDLLGVNSYYGWYEGKPSRSTADLADLEPYLRTMHRRYPRQAMVMTEFGAEATMTGPASVKETYAFQSAYLRRNLQVVERLPWMSGAIYWTLREFAVKPDWDGGALREGVARDAIHNKGLITYDGRAKPAWDVARRAFARRPLYPEGGPGAAALARADGRGALGSPGGLALAGGLLALVGLLAGGLVRGFRDVWRLGGAPAPAAASPAPGRERRLRAVA